VEDEVYERIEELDDLHLFATIPAAYSEKSVP